MTGLAAHKLRYIEKHDSNFKPYKIRGRRYYTKTVVDSIRKTFQNNPDISVEKFLK